MSTTVTERDARPSVRSRVPVPRLASCLKNQPKMKLIKLALASALLLTSSGATPFFLLTQVMER